jgi:hypothetical protein
MADADASTQRGRGDSCSPSGSTPQSAVTLIEVSVSIQSCREGCAAPALPQRGAAYLPYVAEGAIDLLIEGKEPVRLEQGASYYVPPKVRHGIYTHTLAVLLDCFTPLRDDFL